MKFPINYKLMSKFFILIVLIVLFFVAFAFISKPGIETNIAEKESDSAEVFFKYQLLTQDENEKDLEFISDLSTLKKRINVTQKTESLNGVFV